MNFKNKCILITAGPTWIAIDDVRVISNIATGETGILLAEKFVRLGAKVTLLFGCAKKPQISCKVRLIPFRFFNELKYIINRELRAKSYNAIIHNAAVSDFGLRQKKGKVSSAKSIILKLKPLVKIVTLIRRLNKKAKLVIFKLEPRMNHKALIGSAKRAMKQSGADLVVANKLNPYRSFIIDKQSRVVSARSKPEMACKLVKIINS